MGGIREFRRTATWGGCGLGAGEIGCGMLALLRMRQGRSDHCSESSIRDRCLAVKRIVHEMQKSGHTGTNFRLIGPQPDR